MVACGQLWQYFRVVEVCGSQILSFVVTCGKLWSYLVCGQWYCGYLWSVVISCGQLSSVVARLCLDFNASVVG